jgi:hypothetical protein
MKTRKNKYCIIIILTLIIISLVSCGNFEKEAKTPKKQTTLFLLYDISKTYRVQLREQHLREIYDRIAFSGGGTVYIANVLSNSSKQDVLDFTIPFLDSEIAGNTDFQIDNQESLKSEAYNSLISKREEFIKKVKKAIIKPKNQVFSDLKGAMALAKMTFETSTNKHAHKVFLFVSDGIHDARPFDGENRIREPFDLHDVNVIQVRGRRDYYLDAKSIINTVSISDAISNL